MKILIILIKFEKKGAGGVTRVINSIKPILEKKGHKVEIISREEDLGIAFNSGKFFSSFFKLRKEVSKRDYDILYTNDWSCTLPFIFHKNCYCCFHGHNPKGLARFLQTFVGRYMGKKLFVVGDSLKERFPKSVLNYNGVNTNEFYDLNQERKYFGWIKRDYEEKNEEEIRKMAKEKGLKISIADKIPLEKMNEWYNSLKVFASYPPYYAGFNLCWLEAKEAGVPIILGNENGMKISRINNENYANLFNWKNNVNKLMEVFESI